MNSRRVLAALAVLATTAALTAPGARRAGAAPASPVSDAGCTRDRPAIAHHAGGVPLDPQPAGAPVPCGVTTGFGGSESRVNVTNSGSVIYEPAVTTPGPAGLGYLPGQPGLRAQTAFSPGALAVTRDTGATWSLDLPGGSTWVSQDHQGYVDRTTGRFFWYALAANPAPQGGVGVGDQVPGEEAHLLWTADDGRTWTHTTACCPAFSENPRFVAAPAPAGGAQPHGYPNVVYFCANNSILLVSPAGARICSRSLDGGTTWEQRSILFTKPVPQHAECGTQGEDFGPTDGNYPVAMPDGSLIVTVSCGGHTFLARSQDEAASWPVLVDGGGHPLAIPTADELRADAAGNLYSVHADSTHLLVRVSRDVGRSWAGPFDLTAPGIASIQLWFVAVREPGHLALSYLAQAKGGGGLDGWLSETRDLLGTSTAGPTIWSARVNDPERPLMFSANLQGDPFGVLVDYIGADIGPDGTPWASFVQDCGTSPTDAGCTAQQGQTRGFVGRLARGLPAVGAVGAPGGGTTSGGTGGVRGGRLPATGGSPWPPAAAVAVLLLGVGVLIRVRVAPGPARRGRRVPPGG